MTSNFKGPPEGAGPAPESGMDEMWNGGEDSDEDMRDEGGGGGGRSTLDLLGVDMHQDSSSDEGFKLVNWRKAPSIKEKLRNMEEKLLQAEAENADLRSSLSDSHREAKLLGEQLKEGDLQLAEANKKIKFLEGELKYKDAKHHETKRHAAKLHQYVLAYEAEFNQLLERARNAEESNSRFQTSMEGMRTTLYEMQLGLERSGSPARSGSVPLVLRETVPAPAPQPTVPQTVRYLPPRPGHGILEYDGAGDDDEDETPVMWPIKTICNPTDEV